MRRRAAGLILWASLAWTGANAATQAEAAHKPAHKHAHKPAATGSAKTAAKEPAKAATKAATKQQAGKAGKLAARKSKKRTKDPIEVHELAPTPAHPSAHARARMAHRAARKLALEPAPKSSSKESAHPLSKTAQQAAHAAALAAAEAPPKPATRAAGRAADPEGEGFLNLYVELCVKRIGEIDAFRAKLLRDKVPKLQPDSARMYLSGMEGNAWPVPYQGKMGNFVLVLPENKNLCMLYARRTDTAAVEQGFNEMVARPPEPMLAQRGKESLSDPNGKSGTHTLSTSWAPPGSERRMQFMLTTTSAPEAQVQAFGSVAIVVGPEPMPGPEKADARPAAARLGKKPGRASVDGALSRAQP